MEVFQPLANFYEVAIEDGRVGPTHISLYMTLLIKWNISGRENPIVITRDRLMEAAKINARHTYNRCLRELHCYGYITYTFSSHPSRASTVYINPL